LRRRGVADAAIVDALLRYAVAEERRINREMRAARKRVAADARAGRRSLKRFAAEVDALGV
jgi:hypothetical protein